MDALTAFGLFSVTMMLVFYALEERSRWYALPFALACAFGSAYGFLQGAWPFGIVEAIWSIVALRRGLRGGAVAHHSACTRAEKIETGPRSAL
jgi:hypothetical protein